MGDANEVLNERAVTVMRRMSDKLTGRDFMQDGLLGGWPIVHLAAGTPCRIGVPGEQQHRPMARPHSRQGLPGHPAAQGRLSCWVNNNTGQWQNPTAGTLSLGSLLNRAC